MRTITIATSAAASLAVLMGGAKAAPLEIRFDATTVQGGLVTTNGEAVTVTMLVDTDTPGARDVFGSTEFAGAIRTLTLTLEGESFTLGEDAATANLIEQSAATGAVTGRFDGAYGGVLDGFGLDSVSFLVNSAVGDPLFFADQDDLLSNVLADELIVTSLTSRLLSLDFLTGNGTTPVTARIDTVTFALAGDVNPVPVPAAAFLLAPAFAGLAFARRRA